MQLWKSLVWLRQPLVAGGIALSLMYAPVTQAAPEKPRSTKPAAKAYLSALNKLQSKAERVAAQG